MTITDEHGKPYEKDNPLPVDSEVGGWQVSDVDANDSTKYFGFLRKTGAWYIMREQEVDGLKQYRYAVGETGYDFSERGNLTYDFYSAVF